MATRNKLASSRPAIIEDDAGSDTLAPFRRCMNRCVDCIVMSKWVSILFAMLPSIFLSCILMYLNTPTGLPTTVAAFKGTSVSIDDPEVAEILRYLVAPLTNYFGCLAGFTIIFVRNGAPQGTRENGVHAHLPPPAPSPCLTPTAHHTRAYSQRPAFNSSGLARYQFARGR